MPRKKPALLPDSLGYLQPFVNSLAKMRPEDLNEDVDASRLDAALRKRVRGMDESEAAGELAKDRELLGTWLKSSPDHPAHWVLGYLFSPDIAAHVTSAIEPAPRGPRITFEPPSGWKLKAVSFRLDLKKSKVFATIMAIDEFTFHHLQRQFEQAVVATPVPVQVNTEVSGVTFEQCHGKKYLSRMAAPMPWKQVQYVLSVPGGYVNVTLGTMTGADFDETPIEAQLHTLRVSAPEA